MSLSPSSSSAEDDEMSSVLELVGSSVEDDSIEDGSVDDDPAERDFERVVGVDDEVRVGCVV